ncbi:MAG TPA: CHAP domain-containing protein, partial [Candidatus Dormibacteraeota bacterium]|nr:CHAP domain-containing protein [Candidatus Dormibacteraeota bacterium]
ELAQRWTNLAYGETYHGGTHWGVGAAYQMWDVWRPGNPDQANYAVPFLREPNGGRALPQFGDLLVFAPTAGNPFGHVAVVTGLEQGYVDIVEQNWTADAGNARLPMVGTKVLDRGAYQAYGWLRAANAHNVRSLSHTAAHVWTGVQASGDIEAALLGTDSAAWFTAGSGSQYSPPATLNGQLVSAPAAVLDSAGRLELFATDSTHQVARYVTPPPSSPSPPAPAWKSLTGLQTPGKPAVLKAADGHLEVFARGIKNSYWRNHEVAPGGAWSGWTTLGGTLPTDPTAGMGPDGAVTLFGIGTDNALWMWHQEAGSTGSWSSLGGKSVGAPQVTQNASGLLEVFLVGADERVWHKWQTSGANWSNWSSLGGRVLGDPTVVRNSNGMAEVMVIGTDGGLWVTSVTPGGWTAWSNNGGYFQSDVSAQRDAQGLLEAFGVGPGNHLYHAVESAPGGMFGKWTSLGGTWLLN